ncbi:MAG: hypothetical protein LLF97_05855 [Planctomycetaceae bacterium]|nr:hypothetical protein [Planctomycetaceae bacterium]
MVAKNSTYLMTGRSFGEAKPIRCLLEPGKSGQFDSGYAGAGGLFHLADRKEWLLFYHAEDHEGMGRNPHNNIPHGYWSVGMAVFNEKTNNVTKLGQVLRASIPKDVNAGNHGIGNAVVVADPSGKYLYLYYFDLTRQKGSTSQIGLARCAISDGGRPGKWFKYHEGQFTEPGLGGKEGGIITRAWSPSIQYIRSFGCYLMTCDRVYQMDTERETPQDGGIHWCYSKDGIHWSEPQLIVPGLPLPVIGRSNTSHSSLVIEHEDENSVTGTLFYGYTPRRERTPASGRHLVCRSIKFTKRNPSEALADPLPEIWPTVKELKAKCRKIETSKHQEMLAAEISQQQLTPLDIRAVASLRTPQRLVAQECGITDEAMRYLIGLPHLEHLDLRGNPITDASVDILCELKGLTALDIRDTKISSEGLRQLKKALQSCQIVGP